MAKKLSADDLEALAAEVQLLKDKAEIRETLDRYWFGEDRGDPDIVASAFAEDASYGAMRGHDEIRRVMTGLDAYDSMQHCFASSKIEVDGDTATADTMAVGFNVGKDDTGEERCLVRGLRYIDELARTDDGWVITRRRGHDDPGHGHDTFWQFEGVTTAVWHPSPRAGGYPESAV
jgi:SnoaL-like domain